MRCESFEYGSAPDVCEVQVHRQSYILTIKDLDIRNHILKTDTNTKKF